MATLIEQMQALPKNPRGFPKDKKKHASLQKQLDTLSGQLKKLQKKEAPPQPPRAVTPESKARAAALLKKKQKELEERKEAVRKEKKKKKVVKKPREVVKKAAVETKQAFMKRKEAEDKKKAKLKKDKKAKEKILHRREGPEAGAPYKPYPKELGKSPGDPFRSQWIPKGMTKEEAFKEGKIDRQTYKKNWPRWEPPAKIDDPDAVQREAVIEKRLGKKKAEPVASKTISKEPAVSTVSLPRVPETSEKNQRNVAEKKKEVDKKAIKRVTESNKDTDIFHQIAYGIGKITGQPATLDYTYPGDSDYNKRKGGKVSNPSRKKYAMNRGGKVASIRKPTRA